MGENQLEGALPLADVVQQLREEITNAVDAADASGEDLRFRLDKIQLELEVGVTRAAKGESKAKFWVLEFGVGGEVAKSRTQKVVLELTPVAGETAEGGESSEDRDQEDQNEQTTTQVLLGRPIFE